MDENKRNKEAQNNVKNYLKDGLIRTKSRNEKIERLYIEYAQTSLQTAQAVFKLSKESELKDMMGLPGDYESFLWVIVCSYYSMFYAANSVSLNKGIKIGHKIAHKVTLDCLIVFLYLNGKIEKSLLEDFNESKREAMELIQDLSEEELKIHLKQKALEIVQIFDLELSKRSKFQYNMNESLKERYALTSLGRAKRFILEMRKLL